MIRNALRKSSDEEGHYNAICTNRIDSEAGDSMSRTTMLNQTVEQLLADGMIIINEDRNVLLTAKGKEKLQRALSKIPLTIEVLMQVEMAEERGECITV